MAMMSRPPAPDIWLMTDGIKNGFINDAVRVMNPWYTKTEIEENNTPMPNVDAKTMEVTPSRADLANRV